MMGSMAPVLVRGGPIVPRLDVPTGVQEPTALETVVKAARLFAPLAAVITAKLVLPRTILLDLALGVFRDQALVLSAAMAREPGVAIAAAPGVSIAAVPGVATGLTEAIVHALKRPAGDLITGADAPDRMVEGIYPLTFGVKRFKPSISGGLGSSMKVTPRCWFLQTQRVVFRDFQPFLPRPLNPVLVIVMLFTVYNRICGI